MLRKTGVSPEVAQKLTDNLASNVIARIIRETPTGGNLRNPAGLLVKHCQAEIESGAIGKELALEALKVAQAEEARQLNQAEEDLKAAERQRLNELARAWIKTVAAAELTRLSEGLGYAFPYKSETSESHPDFPRWAFQFSRDPKLQEKAASMKAAMDERKAKVKADREAKQEAERVAAEKLATAEAEKNQKRAEWLDAQADRLPAIVEGYFRRFPFERGMNPQRDPRKNTRLADDLREAIEGGRLDVSEIATAQEVGEA